MKFGLIYQNIDYEWHIYYKSILIKKIMNVIVNYKKVKC